MPDPPSLLRPLNVLAFLAAALFFAVAIHLLMGAVPLRPVAGLAAAHASTDVVPAGAVLAFDRPECPPGWHAYDGAGEAGAAHGGADGNGTLLLCTKDRA